MAQRIRHAKAIRPRRRSSGRPGRPLRPRPRSRRGLRHYERAARSRLRRFRQASTLAVALTGLILLVGEPSQPQVPEPGAAPASEAGAAEGQLSEAERSVSEATGTLRELWLESQALLPKLAIALAVLLLAGLVARLVKGAARRVLASWQRAEALSAMASVGIWLLALGTALSIVAGDARALVGSVGLFGLALSWALQAPIESFAGWLLNSFRAYYRVGDRIAVGDVFGDVYRIDFLTTTVWEAGGPDKAVQGAQPTGALITFPNSEVLRANVVNYTRDFPCVWDELTVAIANESDLAHATEAVRRVADRVVGEAMQSAAREYAQLLERERLAHEVATRPEVYLAPAESWTNLTVRYLVPARERRRWSSRLFVEIVAELGRGENLRRIPTGYPRVQMEPAPPEAAPEDGRPTPRRGR